MTNNLHLFQIKSWDKLVTHSTSSTSWEMEERVVDIPEEAEASHLPSSVLLPGSSDDENRVLQMCWGELRQDLRTVYTLVMDGALLDNKHPSLPTMHAAVIKLALSDPHQLFLRLEAELRDVVIQLKSNLAALLSQQEDPAEMFLHSLLLGFERLCDANRVLGPVIGSLETNHLSRFCLTWELLSKHCYQLLVFEDNVIQESLQVCISQLRTHHSTDSSQLEIRYLGLVKEMEKVSVSWAVAEPLLVDYSQEQGNMEYEAEELDVRERVYTKDENVVNNKTSVIVPNANCFHPEQEPTTQSYQYTHSFEELETGLRFESFEAASSYIKNWCNTNQLPLVRRDSYTGSETKPGRILYECPHGTKRKYKDTLVRERQCVNFTACESKVNIYQSLRDKCFKVTKCVKVHSGHLLGDGVYGSYPTVRSMTGSTLNKVMQLEGVGASRRRVASVIGEETGMSITFYIVHIFNICLFHRNALLHKRYLQPGDATETDCL